MSLFKRPAWAQVSSTAGQQETEKDIFSHTERTYASIAAEDRRRRSNPKKSKTQVTRDSPSTTANADAENAGSSIKRRRITAEEADDLFNEMGLKTTLTDDGTNDFGSMSPPVMALRSPSRNTHTSPSKPTDCMPTQQNTFSANVIEILSDSESEPTAEDLLAKPSDELSEDEESDPEIAELKRQARQRRLMATQPRNIEQSKTAPVATGNGPLESSTQNPAIHLFITSPIPNTNPLLVWRRLSQRLQDVKDVWCSRQNFSPEFAQTVFLTHRMHRIYNSTTCRGLGLEVDEYGVLSLRGAEGMDGVDKIHLEAMTEELFAQEKVERDKKERIRLGLGLVDDHLDEPADDPINADGGHPDTRKNIRLMLRTKDKSGLKVKVQPTTHITKIIQACRESWDIPDHHTITLEFDGDCLEPEAEVQSTELEDDMTIDVYIT